MCTLSTLPSSQSVSIDVCLFMMIKCFGILIYWILSVSLQTMICLFLDFQKGWKALASGVKTSACTTVVWSQVCVTSSLVITAVQHLAVRVATTHTHTFTELHLISNRCYFYVTSSHLQVRQRGDKWEWSLAHTRKRLALRMSNVWLKCVHVHVHTPVTRFHIDLWLCVCLSAS